jgi:hypothetical protein
MYRILTEDKNADQVKRMLEGLGLDYTVYYGDGSWRGQAENSMTIELDNASEDVAETVAKLIKQTNFQQSVLLQEIPVTSRLI